MSRSVIAVDIGGTKTAVALVDETGGILAADSVPTPARAGADAVIGTALALAERLVSAASTLPVAVGIGAAGVIDVDRGLVISSTDTLAGWAGTALRDVVADGLEQRLGERLPVHVQNDVDAFATGELRYGAARGAESALVIAVGTGIGASIIVDGRVHRGAHHVAGEIAHVPTPGAERLRCPCGRFGHLEAIGSGVGLLHHYHALGGERAVAEGRSVAERAAVGDPLAARAVQESAAAIGRGVAAAVTVLDPRIVVVAGSVTQAGDVWWTAMRDSVRAEVIDVLQDLPIVAGELGGDAPLLGAAAAAWELDGEKV